ncbi:MAG: SGNH/GDSL hydrolase family protein [Chromatiales bacterium]|nr:SGNH/GDSL hydrolase family protein [Chromatiales bacterium]
MKRLGGIAVFLFILLLGSEIGLRLVALVPTESSTATNDSDIGFRLRPGIPVSGGQTNRNGFNDREHAPKKPDGGYRIAVIGDSFVFGAVRRQQNFVYLLERELSASRLGTEVINLGVPAAGPHNYLALLQHDARQVQANMAVVMVFLGNDILQAHPDFRTAIRFGRTVEILRRPHLLGPSWEYSYVYRLARAAHTLLLNRIEPHPDTAFSHSAYLAVEQRRAQAFRTEPDPLTAQSLTALTDILIEMADMARDFGMDYLVVLAPDELQTNPQLWSELVAEKGLEPTDYKFDGIDTRLTAALESKGIRVVDLLPSLRTAAKAGSLYLPNDSHWNARGNQVAADNILAAIRVRLPSAKNVTHSVQ